MISSHPPLSGGWISSVLSSSWFLNLTGWWTRVTDWEFRLEGHWSFPQRCSSWTLEQHSLHLNGDSSIKSQLSVSSAQYAKPLLCLELGAALSTAADSASWSLHILVAQLALRPIACPVLLSPPWPLLWPDRTACHSLPPIRQSQVPFLWACLLKTTSLELVFTCISPC